MNIIMCDCIWETYLVHTSDFAHLEIHKKPQGKVYRFETFRYDKRIVVLQSLNVSHLFVILKIFYESQKLKTGCVNYA